jgi:hypothetical protein
VVSIETDNPVYYYRFLMASKGYWERKTQKRYFYDDSGDLDLY